jgi:dipicolinate synthase subunit B
LKNGESDLRKERIGFAMCGSFCTHGEVLRALERLAEEYETIIPIVSEISGDADTRFGTAEALLEKVEQITGRKPLRTITEVEPIGPKGLLDLLAIAPATGNTLAKLAAGITDTAVTMATKAHLRNGRPVVVAIASNDGLGAGAKNIGELLVRKNYYFVPFGQDAAFAKPTSLIADFGKLTETVDAALRGEQIQPILRIE